MNTLRKLLSLFLVVEGMILVACEEQAVNNPTTQPLPGASVIQNTPTPGHTATQTFAPYPIPTSTRQNIFAPTVSPSPIPFDTPPPGYVSSTPIPPPRTATPTPSSTPRTYNRADRVLFFRDSALWTSDLLGGDPVQITPPGFLGSRAFEGDYRSFPPRVSPDGRYMVTLTDGRGTWLLSNNSGQQPRYVEQYAYPSWSPDSSALTYTVSDTVYVRELNLWDEPRRIAQLSSLPVAYAEWSPDGNWIAFLAFEKASAVPSGAKQQLWLVRPDATQLHMLESIDALGRERGPVEVQWGDSGRIVMAADSWPWLIAPGPEHQFTYPFALPYEPPRIRSLSPTKPFAAGKSNFSTFGIKFDAQVNAWPSITELRQCEGWLRAWSPDGTRLLCTPESMSRMSVEIFDGSRDFANWGHVFNVPGPDYIFFTPNGDELVFETRLDDETDPIIWRAVLDPLAKARRIGAGMLFDVFRIK